MQIQNRNQLKTDPKDKLSNNIIRVKDSLHWIVGAMTLYVIGNLCGRYISLTLSLLLIAWLIVSATQKKTKKYYIILFLLYAITLVSMVSPIDICVSRSNKFSVDILPVVLNNGSSKKLNKLRKEGKIEGKDFVLYTWSTVTHPQKSIVIFIPL
jgi:hypothetical protein